MTLPFILARCLIVFEADQVPGASVSWPSLPTLPTALHDRLGPPQRAIDEAAAASGCSLHH